MSPSNGEPNTTTKVHTETITFRIPSNLVKELRKEAKLEKMPLFIKFS